MTLILVGYMGSGKSSVGSKLSKILNYDFIDLDSYIEKQVGLKVEEIFKRKGEIFFRKQEHLCLKEVADKANTVVALGGGTPCYGSNLEIIKQGSYSKLIYLKASISNLSDRLFQEKSSRPMISHLETKDELIEFVGKHLFERAPIYEQADVTIKTDALSVDKVVEAILLTLY
jgi:shikimate kinase